VFWARNESEGCFKGGVQKGVFWSVFLWYLGCFERALKMSRFGRVLRVVCAYLTKTEKIEPTIKM